LGCLKLTYYQTPELRIISNRKELTFNKSVLKERRAYLYGFNGQEVIPEIYGEGNYLDFTFRGYNPRLGRFFSIDPIDHLYPELTPYQHSSLNPIWNLELEGLEGKHFQLLQRRNKPKVGNNIRGTGLIVLLGGTRGKFFRHNSLHMNNKPVAKPIDNDLVTIPSPPDKDKAVKEPNNSLPLDRDTRNGEDEILNNRKEFVPTNPEDREGEFEITFDTELDDDGNIKPATIQIGKIDKDGNEVILQQTTTDEPGSLKTDFKLKKGEKLFQRTINTGDSTTKATKKEKDK